MSSKLNSLLKEVIAKCETEADITLVRRVLEETVLSVPDSHMYKYVEQTVKDLVETLELPKEGSSMNEIFLDKLTLLQEEIIFYCKDYFEASLDSHLKRIYSDLVQPENYGPMLLARIMVLCSSKVCIGDREIRDVLKESKKLLLPLYEKVKEGFDIQKPKNLLPKEKVFNVSAVQTTILNYHKAFLAALEEDPKMYEHITIAFYSLLDEIEFYYEKTLTIN